MPSFTCEVAVEHGQCHESARSACAPRGRLGTHLGVKRRHVLRPTPHTCRAEPTWHRWVLTGACVEVGCSCVCCLPLAGGVWGLVDDGEEEWGRPCSHEVHGRHPHRTAATRRLRGPTTTVTQQTDTLTRTQRASPGLESCTGVLSLPADGGQGCVHDWGAATLDLRHVPQAHVPP